MKVYKITFKGRIIGSIGITYTIFVEVEADTIEQAIKKLYKNYEHISNIRIHGFKYMLDGSLILDEQEFKRGDIVTFHPYEKAIKAKVLEVIKQDGDYFYKLEGISESLISKCSGNSIEESKYYKMIEPLN